MSSKGVAENDSCNSPEKDMGGFTTKMMTEARVKNIIMNDIESDWYIIRRQVLKRDHYTCQGCGISEKGCYRSLDVHHIVPVSKGGSNKLDNLITVCPKCHPTEEAKGRYGLCVMVERTFHIPIGTNDKLRMEARMKQMKLSEIATLALREYLK